MVLWVWRWLWGCETGDCEKRAGWHKKQIKNGAPNHSGRHCFTPGSWPRQRPYYCEQKGQGPGSKRKKRKNAANWNSHRFYLPGRELAAGTGGARLDTPVFFRRNKIIQASRSIKYNRRFNYRASLEIYWPHFRGLQASHLRDLQSLPLLITWFIA